MRMWLVDPSIMCNRHLLGEHVEIHMFVGALRNRTKITGYIRNDLLEPLSLFERHNELVEEMKNRGFKHMSDLDIHEGLFDYLSEEERSHRIDRAQSLKHLLERCDRCRLLYNEKRSASYRLLKDLYG